MDLTDEQIKKQTHFQEKYFKSKIIRPDIKWLFFDVGGVLIDTSLYGKWRLKRIFSIIKKYNPKISKKYFTSILPKVSRTIGNLDKNIFYLFLDKNIAEKVQKDFDQEKEKELKYYWQISKPRSEAKKILEVLSKNYKLGLIANQPVIIRDKLKRAGLLKYFSSAKVSDDFKFYKPDLRLFRKILKDAQANPKKSVMIDDNIERGLVPAKKLGMTTVWLKTSRRKNTPKNMVNFEINSLADLLKIFNL